MTVAFSDAWGAEAREGVLSDLSAALGPQSMSVCEATEGQDDQPVSTVQVTLVNDHLVTIFVDDTLTNKRVSRDVKLRDFQDSASALVVAVAVDELLRATWAELSLNKSQEPPEPQPEPQPQPEPKPEPAPQAADKVELPAHRLALRGAVDSYFVASTLVGGDIAYGGSWYDSWEWTAFAGPRFARAPNASEVGEVRADALSFGMELGYPLIKTRQFFFGPELSILGTHAWYQGKPSDLPEGEVEASELSGWALSGRLGLSGRLHISSAFVALSSRVGVPVVGLEVTDDSGVVGGMSGVEWSSSASLGWWWSR